MINKLKRISDFIKLNEKLIENENILENENVYKNKEDKKIYLQSEGYKKILKILNEKK